MYCFIVLRVLLLNITWVFKRDVCVVVEWTYRPTSRVISRLYRERTKTCLRTNQEALSNRSDWFWDRLNLMIQNGGHILLGTGQTGFKVYQTSFETIIQNGGQIVVKPVFNVYQTSFENWTCLYVFYIWAHKKKTIFKARWERWTVWLSSRSSLWTWTF